MEDVDKATFCGNSIEDAFKPTFVFSKPKIAIMNEYISNTIEIVHLNMDS